MRRSEAVAALIGRAQVGRAFRLAKWGPRRQVFRFLVGHERPGEGDPACLVREIAQAERLGEWAHNRVSADGPKILGFMAPARAARVESRSTMAPTTTATSGSPTGGWRTWPNGRPTGGEGRRSSGRGRRRRGRPG
jgi:hypothetical protein